MKLETKKQIEFATNSSFESIDASISSTDMHKLWDMLQNPYKDNISSIVRECTSNSFDAHAEAMFIKNHSIEEIRTEYSVYNTVEDEELLLLKKHLQHCNNDPVVVSLEKDETGWYWSTEDVGVGLSPSRIRTVFVNYLKSTKELSNTMIGAFGMGSKSPLSYTDLFFIRTRYNGIEYHYMLRKGENGPALDVIGQEPTEKVNGTEIKIYLNTENDIRFFRTACEKQLCYFDNVYFSQNTYVSNDYQLVKGEHWIASTKTAPYSGLHICLGTVAYPIDWSILELPSIDELPIALQFEIGELDVIQTREDVKYTPRTKEAIYKKIELLRTELHKRWSEIDKECASIEEFYKKKDLIPSLSFLEGKINFRIKDFTGIKDNGYYYKPFKDAGITINELPTYADGLFFEYLITGQFISRFQSANWIPDLITLKRGKVYRITGNHEPTKSKYILDSANIQNLYLLRKGKTSLKLYVNFLKLKRVDKSKWRTIISVYQKEIQKLVISLTQSYDKIVIDQDWLNDRKKIRAKKDNSVIKVVNYSLAANDYSYPSSTASNTKVSEFINAKRTTFIVGSPNDEKHNIRLIHNVYAWFTKTPSKYLKRIEVAPTNIKKLKDVKNLVTMESFMSEDNKVFRRTMSFFKMYKLYKKQITSVSSISYTQRRLLLQVCPLLAKELNKFESILSNSEALISLDKKTNFLSTTCYNLAKQEDLWDLKFEQEFKNMLDLLLLIPSEALDNVQADFLFDYLYLKKQLDSKFKKLPLDIHRLITARGKYQTPKKVNTPKINVTKLLKEEIESIIN